MRRGVISLNDSCGGKENRLQSNVDFVALLGQETITLLNLTTSMHKHPPCLASPSEVKVYVRGLFDVRQLMILTKGEGLRACHAVPSLAVSNLPAKHERLACRTLMADLYVQD